MRTTEEVRQKFEALKSSLNERTTRLWAGAEAQAMGHGGVTAVAAATGLAISTVRKGRDELREGAAAVDLVTVRRKGAG
ncbi:MAG: ISAzo13 family transposase, partial [Deltaproteobacteria bacterium]|nr:ISAzo13 family transposase [Deltaproteobacteria bacterium]